MKYLKHIVAICILSTLLGVFTACGIISGGSTNSEGSENISFDASTTSFDASSAAEAFKSIPYKNTTGASLTLYKVMFTGNSCNSFSYYGVNDANGNIVAGPADSINFTFKNGERVQAIIRFKSEACAVTNYSTTVYLYFRDAQNRTFSSATVLQVRGEPPAGTGNDSTSCIETLDEDTLIEDRRFGIPGDGKHYLRVDGMRAFIFPPESEQYKTVIGTDIGAVDPDAFISPYLTVNITDKTTNSATINIEPITSCTDFSIPSALTDAFFLGSPTLLTTNKSFQGTINLVDAGTGFKTINVNVPNFRAQLLAENVGDLTPQNDKSIIVDPVTKTFRIGVKTVLTTETTESDAILFEQFPTAENATDSNGNSVLDIVSPKAGESALQGTPLADSKITLVGKGVFDNSEEDFIGDVGTAKQFLIDKTAYIYVQIRATLMCSSTEAGCQ